MTDDMHCAVCNADVFDPNVDTYTLMQWESETQRNVFIAAYCKDHKPDKPSE